MDKTGSRNHWIAGAIKHVGALHKQMGYSPDQRIPHAKLVAAASKGGIEGRRANLALTLKKMALNRKKG
jgi:hypothetical protein